MVVVLNHDVTGPFIRRLESVISLTGSEKAALQELSIRVTDVRADQDVIRQGDRPKRMFFIIEGMTCTYKLAAESKRQIMTFHISGDAPDLQSIHLTRLDVSIATITPCKLGFVEYEEIHRLCHEYPRITAALWRHTLIDAAIFREWMTSIGQRAAVSRIAHLLCELFIRFQAVGLVKDNSVHFPITQAEIGDALGITPVHVNRSLQALRSKGYIVLCSNTLQIRDWEGLQEAGDFHTEYLHLKEPIYRGPTLPSSANRSSANS
jgi:CRP-like cAMP-binding protein